MRSTKSALYRAYKKLAIQDAFDTVSKLTKTLIQADESAKMVAEDLEDMPILDPGAVHSINDEYGKAVACTRKAAEHIQQAAKYCSEAKRNLRVIFPQESSVETPSDTTIDNPAVTSRKTYRSLRTKKHYTNRRRI